MRITRLVLSDFGKFHQKEVTLSAGLNIATGANEAGKTTLRYFIRSMWYGLERERGMKARNDDYSRLKPWDYGRFQGILEFEAEGKSYRLFRSFLTTQKEIILTDLSTGREIENPSGFLRNLGLPSERVYTNTFWIGNACATEELLAQELKDYLANLAYGGGAGLNLQKSLAWLTAQKKAMLKQVPEKELSQCREQMLTKETFLKQKEEAENALEALQHRQKELDDKIKEKKKQAGEIRNALDRVEEEKSGTEKKRTVWNVLSMAFLTGLLVSVFVTGWQVTAMIGFLLLVSLFPGYRLRKQRKQSVRTGEELSEQLSAVTAEVETGYEELTELLPETEQRKLWAEQTEEQLKQCEIAEERYEELQQRQKELEEEAAAISLAADTLEEISGQLYEEFGEKFGASLSAYAKAFTDQAYETLMADDGLNLKALTGERSLGVSEVSFGTAEQFYMALRFAAADVFDPEKKNTIILDDSFASFDEQRLESAILTLSNSGRQVLLLSSTGREEAAAKRMGITYEAVF